MVKDLYETFRRVHLVDHDCDEFAVKVVSTVQIIYSKSQSGQYCEFDILLRLRWSSL